MKNIVLKDNKFVFLGFTISKDDFGYDLIFSKDVCNTDKKYIFSLSSLLQDKDDLVIGKHPAFTINELVDYFNNRENPSEDYSDFIRDYDFPPIYKERKLYIKLEGAISKDSSKWKIIYPKSITTYGPVAPLEFSRKDLNLYSNRQNKIIGSLDLYSLQSFLVVEDANNKWNTFSQEERYKVIQKLQGLASKGEITLDTNLSYKIISPEKIVPKLIDDKEGYKHLTAEVDLEDINQDLFNQQFEDLNLSCNIYSSVDEEGATVKVLLSDEQKQVLQDIKNQKNATEEQLRQFLKNPPENWNDQIVDTSELYSDRVRGWIQVMPADDFNIKESENNWYQYAKNEDFDKHLVLEVQSHEKKSKIALEIKDNEDELDYEEKLNAEIKKFRFPTIPGGYKDNIEPKDYQKEGIAWIYSLYNNKCPGCILADDMGLGKTFQVLSFIQAISDTTKLVLIVTPASLLDNWKDEYTKFFNESRYKIIIKNKNKLKNILEKQKNGTNITDSIIFITNYENLRANKEYLMVQWNVVILDEAQRIKNASSLTNNTARGLKTDFKVAVTGTPVENDFSDIWAIADFTIPGQLGTHKHFNQKYSANKFDSDESIKAKGLQLRKELGIRLLRRTKDLMLKNLPEKEYVKLNQFMPETQEKAYKAVQAEKLVCKQLSDYLIVLQAMKKVSDHYGLMKQYDTGNYSFNDTAKTKLLKNILNDIKNKNEKVIVFAEYIKTQEILASIIFDEFKIKPSIYNGTVPLHSRKILLDRFKKSDGFNVIIMSPIAAGVGLTITEANHVIHYSRHWNPAKEDQATDRVYRIGQKKKVYVYNLIGKIKGIQTFDEKLDALLSRKQNIKGAVLFPSNRLEISNEDFIKSVL